jgi:4-amino-4-deoxy-L-arabinose transferase-like glycosyltransferase
VRHRSLLLVFGAAILVRVAYVALLDPTLAPISDASSFHVLGDLIRHNQGYLVPSKWLLLGEAHATAEFGPAHPTVLAVANFVGLDTVRGQQYFMSVLGSVTPVLTALLAWRLTRRHALAVGAGLVAAVNPMLFGSDGALMTETLYTLCATALLLLLVVLHRSPGDGDGDGAGGPTAAPGTRGATAMVLVAGVLLGMAVLTRGDALLLVPLVVVPLLWRRWRELMVLLVVGAAVVSPWVLRNHARFGQFVLSTNVGQLINGANCPESYAAGDDLGGWNFSCAYRLELTGNEAVDSARLRDNGIEYAREHLGRLPVVVGARIARGWGLLQPFGQAEHEAETEARVVGTQQAGVVLTWVLLPLALVGAWLLRERGALVVLGPVLTATVLFAGTYGISRFGEVAQPAMVVGAAVAVTSVIDRVRRRAAHGGATSLRSVEAV